MPCSFVTSLALLLVSRATGASQGLQDEIIASLFDKLGTTNREYVEFGFDSNEHCSGGGGSNTCRLMQQGWTGLLMDGGHKNESINLHRHLLSSRNIGHLLRLYRVRQEVDYLSADLDSADLWVVRAILLEGFRPRVFQVEYNSHFPWDYAIAFPDPAAMANTTLSTWSGTCAYGASARAFALLFSEFDYVPAAFVIGMDLFFVPRALAAHHGVPALDLAKAPLEIHFHAGAEQLTHAEAQELVDFRVWQRETLVNEAGPASAQRLAQESAKAQLYALAKMPHQQRFTCAHAAHFGRDCARERIAPAVAILNPSGQTCFEPLADGWRRQHLDYHPSCANYALAGKCNQSEYHVKWMGKWCARSCGTRM